MKCNEVRELLSLYIDNMLDEDLATEIKEHLASCPECRGEYKMLMSLAEILAATPDIPLPPSFDEKLHQALVEIKTPKRETVVKKSWGIKRLSGVAAIFVVGIFAIAMYNNSDQLIPNLFMNGSGNDEAYVSQDSDAAIKETNPQDGSDGTENSVNEKQGAVASFSMTVSGETFSPESSGGDESAGAVSERENAAVQSNSANQRAVSEDDRESSNELLEKTQPFSSQGEESLTDEFVAFENDIQSETDSSMTPEISASDPYSGGASRGDFYLPDESEDKIVLDYRLTGGAIGDARDSVAIKYYLRALEKELADKEFEILACTSMENGLWKFEVQFNDVSTDDEEKEDDEIVIYYGQDGTLWREEL